MSRRAVLLACSSILAAACAGEAAAPVPAVPPPAPVAPAAPTPPPPRAEHDPRAQVLVRGAPVERELGWGEVHRYEVALEAGQILLGTVDQRGVDVVVSLYDPEGRKIADVDSPNGAMGPEPVVLRAKAAGLFHFEVRGFGEDAAHPQPAAPHPRPRRYEARVDEILTEAGYEERLARRKYASDALFGLWKGVRDEGSAAEERFWKAVEGKAPIVEPLAGDDGHVRITFVYRGDDDTKYVGLGGGPSSAEKPMSLLEGTHVWYLTARVPKDARFTYVFFRGEDPPPFDISFTARPARYEGATFHPDPLNPVQFSGGSLVELPDAPAQPWIQEKAGVPQGAVAVEHIASEKLHEDRRIGVYTPPGFSAAAGPYPLVVVYDGDAAGLTKNTLIPLARILDNLLAAGKIPPVIAALVDSQGTRTRDLPMSAPFADFVADELVPMLRRKYRVSPDPEKAVVTGVSYGGLCAVYTAVRHPKVFHNVLSQSGSFWFFPHGESVDGGYEADRGVLMREIAAMPRLPLRFFLDAGRLEALGPWDILSYNRHMRDVLVARGYPVTYVEFDGGHDWIWWRGLVADGLMALLGPKAKR
jgi:enterochelin esterase family protein